MMGGGVSSSKWKGFWKALASSQRKNGSKLGVAPSQDSSYHKDYSRYTLELPPTQPQDASYVTSRIMNHSIF